MGKYLEILESLRSREILDESGKEGISPELVKYIKQEIEDKIMDVAKKTDPSGEKRKNLKVKTMVDILYKDVFSGLNSLDSKISKFVDLYTK